ncbi:aminoglycoside phosphotransferase family protein [Streptomyces zagrosensis]|uniref:Streptomycin 6-kinase n=1 Tax=Streptomyces zagrosensis TaxID=1042984 RepID=A0A7W9QGT2_9ACTN|nr:aminoglycoside phosphotransferase family protein [Streptomyces zagrosensis]MBB5940016.1 streptomycin 6-kinase [Streptomyces zagrosensis]
MAAAPQDSDPEHTGVHIEPPQSLVRALQAEHGNAGQAWLATVPERVGRLLARWELAADRVWAPGGRASLLVSVRQADNTPAMLKLSMVTERAEHEQAALSHWDGSGAVQVLRSEPADGALLLERLHGEVSLRSLPEPKSMLEAAETVRRLWVPPPAGHVFPTVTERTTRHASTLRESRDRPWATDAGPLIDEALAAHAELTATSPEELLLHGDYQQGKVLAGDRAPWLAIAPKPVAGERAYDLAWLTRDRLDTLIALPGAANAARRRVNKLADSLELDRDRLRGWTLFRSVVAGVHRLTRGQREDGELLLEFAGWL